MINNLELQLRALRPPRVLKKNGSGEPELMDVWAIHHSDRSCHQWAIAVKFGREITTAAAALNTGTLFTVKGRLDQSQNPKTHHYHTFIWANEILDLVPSRKKQPVPAGTNETPELDLPEIEQEEENPEPEIPHA
jgi:hypothetical protein